MQFIFLAFLIAVREFDTRRKTKENHHTMLCLRRENHIITKCSNEDAMDLCPVHKIAFYLQRCYAVTINYIQGVPVKVT